MDLTKRGRMEIQPGEGERRAQRGYVTQYDFAASLIYEGLASGKLHWIGVADRQAGNFDDLVLGYANHIFAYQVKASADPSPFSIRTLLIGAENLLGKIVKARQSISRSAQAASVEIIYVSDNFPRTDDSITDLEPPMSSAAYLRAHEAHRLSWTLPDWKSSIYAGFVTNVRNASGLDDLDFETLWRFLSFKTGAESRECGLPFPSSDDQRRIKQIAALLPRLVADHSDQDRWSVHEVLTKLQWDSPFTLRHSHTFPVDALYESNQETQQKLSETLHGVKSGYVALVGPPGTGKSTLLAAGIIPSPRARILRYLAFVPGKGQGLGRAESFDFLHDLVRQFKLQGFGKEIIPGAELQELRMQLERVLGQAAEQHQIDGVQTIIVVDGLDHVPREERPQRSFLNDFPLPDSIPEGVIFLLGTQRLDLTDLPASVKDQASEEGRLIQVSPLSPSAVARLAELAGVSSDVDGTLLYKKTSGHPLAVRYVIDGLQNAAGPEARQKWLQEGPAYGGDVDVFYNRAWHDLENNPDAQRGMAYLALAEGAISPVSLDSIIGTLATDAVWRAASHLLRIDRQRNWSVFHNSFRLFLQTKLSLRHGVPNADLVRARYIELADMAAKAGPEDGQQWLELRYRIRAEQFDRALPLATPDRFRDQFFAGRSPEDIRGDIAMSFLAAKANKSMTAVLSLIFAGHELDMRMEVIGDDLIDAYIALGFFDRARGLVDAEPFSMTTGKGFDLVEILLEVGDLANAKDLFNSLEPLDVLLGAKEIFESRTKTELEQWAEQALAFRTTDEFITSLKRMRVSDRGPHTEDLPAQLEHLKLLAVRGQLMRNPEISPHELAASVELGSGHDLLINYLALKAAFESGIDDLASERLEICADAAMANASGLLLQISHTACQLSRDDIAKKLIEFAPIPSLDLGDYHYEDADLRMAEKNVILASSLRARFSLPAVHGKVPKSALLDMYQQRLENLGSIHGSLLAEPTTSNFPLTEMNSLLDFLERAQGAERFDFERGRITRTMDVILRPMLEAAHAHSDETLGRLAAEIDDRLNRSAQYLTISSFRRVFALEMFQYEDDSAAAIRRIAYQPGREDTPQSEFEEVTKTISAFLQVSLRSEAEKLLACVQTEGLGISRPAKKDGQYILWEGFLQEANRADPVHRRDRVLFIARFFSGLAETEGRGVAQRAASTLIREAAMIDAGTAAKVIDIVEDCNLSTWSDIVENIALGAIRKDPTYSEVAAVIFGRLSIPLDESVSRSTLSEILQLAPEPELEKIRDLLAACVQTDAPLDSRILALETIVDSIKRRGCEADTSGLVRWRAELPPPKSGNSPEDPFFLARSIEDISSLLDQYRGKSGAYGARSAFLRVLEWADFEAANALFIKETDLNSDERLIEVMARRSWAEGKHDEAKLLLGSLLKIAEEKGSWGGGWRSQAKLQYHRLARDLGMEDASKAFDALVDDLAAGKESYEYILPDLHEILDVVVSTIDWESAWDVLAKHLSRFREFERGIEVIAPASGEPTIEGTVADLIRRGIGTTATSLVNLARAAAIEMSSVTHGQLVLQVLLPDLLSRGEEFAVEAAQVIWESRKSEGLKPFLQSLLPQMLDMKDIAIRSVAERLCEAWDLPSPLKHQELPAIYSVVLPNPERYASFDPPYGVSAFSAGLFTEDALTWTWILERQLQLASRASEIELANIRHRVAEIMRRMGGESKFGPEAVKSQLARMRRLSLHATYTKLMSQTALQAFREAVGELYAADAINPDTIPFLGAHSGAYSPVIPTRFPVPRPQTFHAVRMPEIFGRQEGVWIDDVAEDLVAPTLADGIVLAAVLIHERGFREEKWVAEQYYGPKLKQQKDELFAQLRQIPPLLVTDRLNYSFSRPCPGFVAHILPTIPGFEVCPISLCPLGAAALGWLRIPGDAFTFTDALGERSAWVLYWRDGGIAARETDSSIHRHGFALVIEKKYGNQLRQLLPTEYEMLTWRRQQKEGEDVDFKMARYEFPSPAG